MAKIKSLDELRKEIENEKKVKIEKNEIKEIKELRDEKDKKETNKIKKDNVDKSFNDELKEEIAKKVSGDTKISLKAVKVVMKLLEEGNTIPFIARYRKEMTGSLDDVSLRNLEESLKKITNLYTRKEEVLRLIEESGNLTDEIEKEIHMADTLARVEDIYRPFKSKRKTRGSEAKRKGLEGLSKYIFKQDKTISEIEKEANKYLNEEVKDIEEAISGASDIIAENISNDINIREKLRKHYWKNGVIKSTKKDKAEDEEEIYKNYYEFSENILNIPSHRILAILRGERENILNVKIEVDDALDVLIRSVIIKESKIKELLTNILKDSLDRLIHPSIEREIKTDLKEKADKVAIDVFKENLKSLLITPPFKNVKILGMDPGFRTGCKLAVIDESGKVLDYGVIYPVPPKMKLEESRKILLDLIDKWNIDIISIGNGTASRETESFVVDTIKGKNVKYIITSEAGASVYSASKVGEEEFPDLDVTIRGAISIARRIGDPMAEFVKIDPKSIGVGQYQHDVDQKMLGESLENAVEDIVNKVGVDVNTATYSLLTYISGLTKKTAQNIVKFREENGKFKKREELKKVSGIGDVSYNQSVGFLRIYEGKDILDSTGIHPESYNILNNLLEKYSLKKEDIKDEKLRNKFIEKIEKSKKEIVDEYKVGLPTIEDIIIELKKPGRDIRDEAPKPILREDILSFEDIQIGQKLKGTVRNVTAFGAFVDIGIKNDGLVHISELSNKFIKDPNDVVKVGDIVDVKVIDKNDKTQKVSLSMKKD